MKRTKPTIQGSYGEIFQPDVIPRWQLWTGCILLIAVLIPLVIWSIRGGDPVLPGVTALLAVIFVLFEGKNVMVNRRNCALAFGVTPEKLTVLWNGQPVKVIPWGDVMEIFVTAGPSELRDRRRSYGVYISLQYGYESRLYKAKRQILNLHISPDSMRHLEDFPVLRICESMDYNRCQRLVSRFEGYRNAAWARKYETKNQ